MILPPTAEVLFRELGLGLVLVEDEQVVPTANHYISASVALTADILSGALRLKMPRSTVDELRRRVPSTPEDWVAELCNQIAGRFGNRLSKRGVSLRFQPPVMADENDAKGEHVPPDQRWVFRSGANTAVLELEFKVSDNFDFVAPGVEPSMAEGQLVFFGDDDA